MEGTGVITELEVGDGSACCVTTLASDVASSILGTWREAGCTIVGVGCKDNS